MTPLTPPFRLLAQVPPGLEPLLMGELAALGIVGTPMQGGVRWTGGWTDLFRANLELRTASRILIELGHFRVRALGELERKAAALPWDQLPPGPVRFRISASRSRLYHEGAIEERLRRAAGLPLEPSPRASESDTPLHYASEPDAPRPVSPEGPLLVVRVHRDELTLRLDTSGDHLHRRGYRIDVGEAPLRETLAAALLAILSPPYLTPDATAPDATAPGLETQAPSPNPILDPFCGAGTIPIEAALLRRRIPPGLASPGLIARPYAFLAFPGVPLEVWDATCTAARDRVVAPGTPTIFGSDRDGRVLAAARRNALRAGVEGDIAWSEAPLSKCPVPDTPGWIVTNPPWGGRLGERKRLRALYNSLGGSLRPGGRMRGWGLVLLSGDPVLADAMGLTLDTRFRTTHGGLSVQAVQSAPAGLAPAAITAE